MSYYDVVLITAFWEKCTFQNFKQINNPDSRVLKIGNNLYYDKSRKIAAMTSYLNP